MTYIVGVDSGGTYTNVCVVGADETETKIAELDKSLTSNRSIEELRAVLSEIISAVAGHTYQSSACVWINAAGYAAATRNTLEQLLREATHDIEGRFGIANDGVSLLLAHEEETVTVVAGTGSVAMARRPTGEVITRGGDEWVVADYGSAFWIGLNGIRAAYKALEGGPDTALRHHLVGHYTPLGQHLPAASERIAVREIARHLAARGTGTKPTIASFAPRVTQLAELGDAEAQKIVRASVDELAAASARVYRELAASDPSRFVRPRFLLSGSVAFRSPFYAEAFKASLVQFLFDVTDEAEHTLDLSIQLNGMPEALQLARQLAADDQLPVLDDQHPYSVIP